MRLRAIAFLTILLVAAAPARAFQHYDWLISGSPSSPCAFHANFPTGSLAHLFLWYILGEPDGLNAADFSLEQSPPGALTVLGFNTSNGFLNAGTSTDLLLVISGCPNGPIVAGHWLLLPQVSAWEVCLGGQNISVNCDVSPTAYPNHHNGFPNNSPFSTSCCGIPVLFEFCDDQVLCDPVTVGSESLERESWGRIKGAYR